MPKYFKKSNQIDTDTKKPYVTGRSQGDRIMERLSKTSDKRLIAILARKHQTILTKHQQEMIENNVF